MARILVRVSFLLFVLSFAGLAGLSSSANPMRIRSAHAASVDIQVSSNNGPDLDFSIGVIGCPDWLAPGTSCTANVSVFNAGTDPVRLSTPTISESGVLETCSGDDPLNPGTAGNNLTAQLANLSFTPNVTVVAANQTATFDVNIAFAFEATNACQGKTGLVEVQIMATGPDDVVIPPGNGVIPNNPGPTSPVVINNPSSPASQGSTTLINQVGGSTSTTSQPGTNLVSEVLPARLPATGQGFERQANGIARAVFIGMALIGAGLLISAGMVAKSRRQAR